MTDLLDAMRNSINAAMAGSSAPYSFSLRSMKVFEKSIEDFVAIQKAEGPAPSEFMGIKVIEDQRVPDGWLAVKGADGRITFPVKYVSNSVSMTSEQD